MTDLTLPKKRQPKTKSTASTQIVPAAMTIEQFRSYLKGITFVGGPDWHPNRQQWEAIVEMIDNLILSAPQQSQQQPQPQYAQQYQSPPVWQPPPGMVETSLASSPPPDDGSYRSPFV